MADSELKALGVSHTHKHVPINVVICGASKHGTTSVAHWLIVLSEKHTEGYSSPCACTARILEDDLSLIEIRTANMRFALLHTHGSDKQLKNVASACAVADVALVVIDASSKDLQFTQSSTAKSIKSKIIIAYTQMITTFVVAVTHLDLISVDKRQEELQRIANWVADVLKRNGVKEPPVVVPCCSSFDTPFLGSGIASPADFVPGHEGLTLVQALEQTPAALQKRQRLKQECPFQFMVLFTHKNTHKHSTTVPIVVCGRVFYGPLHVGESLFYWGADGAYHTAAVERIQIFDDVVDTAPVDAIVFLQLRGVPRVSLSRGTLLGKWNHTLMPSIRVEVKIVLLTRFFVKKGWEPFGQFGALTIPCKVEAIVNKFDKRTAAVIEVEPNRLKMGDGGTLILRLSHPVSLDYFKPGMRSSSRLALYNGVTHEVAGVGIVKKMERHWLPNEWFHLICTLRRVIPSFDVTHYILSFVPQGGILV